MARIRTIKPEFFRHHDLYLAEVETGLPLRLAFAGLWTVCDREGRFRWCPAQIKLDCLPYDDVDFSRVLDALATRGFIVKYAWQTQVFGCVPSFLKHQVVNNRERSSEIPPPDVSEGEANTSTRASRVGHACPTPLNLDQVEQGTRNKEQGKEQGKETRVRNAKPSKTLTEALASIGPEWTATAPDLVRWIEHVSARGKIPVDPDLAAYNAARMFSKPSQLRSAIRVAMGNDWVTLRPDMASPDPEEKPESEYPPLEPV